MILIRNVTTGESFGIFDNASEIKEEYPMSHGEYKRLRELSSHNRPYIIKRIDGHGKHRRPCHAEQKFSNGHDSHLIFCYFLNF